MKMHNVWEYQDTVSGLGKGHKVQEVRNQGLFSAVAMAQKGGVQGAVVDEKAG